MKLDKLKSFYNYIKEEIEDRLEDFDITVFCFTLIFIGGFGLLLLLAGWGIYDGIKNHEKYAEQEKCCQECKI